MHYDFCVFSDINECTAGTHNCNQGTQCINTIGSFRCTCPDGYSYDGTTCKGKQPLADLIAHFYITGKILPHYLSWFWMKTVALVDVIAR